MVFLLKLFRRDSKSEDEKSNVDSTIIKTDPDVHEKSDLEESTDSITDHHNCQVTLKVGNIPWTMTPSEIHLIFSKWGNCKIEKCGPERASKSFCLHFSYNDQLEGEKALSNGMKLNLKGQPIQVRIASAKQEEVSHTLDDSPSRSDAAAMRRRRKQISSSNY